MPELRIVGIDDARKTNKGDVDGWAQRDKVSRQVRIRAQGKSDVPIMTVHLRSINVTLDSATPQRIAHFFPTAKSARLLRSWLHPDQCSSYFVVAPYGTGKSLTATFFIQVVENLQQSGEVLARISERLTKVDSELASELRSRIGSDQMPLFGRHGATVALSGYQPHLPTAIKQSLIASLRRTGNKNIAALASRRRADSMDDIIALLSAVRDRYCPDPIDRLAIVWDEFGRHLEELIIRGTATDLSDVQTLAEFCARTKRVPTTFALLLHQGLIRYATSTSVTVQREWKKIEGRFETVQFVDDSKELYQLVSQIVRHIRPSGPPARDLAERGVQICRDTGLFGNCAEQEAERMLSDSYPLEPLTLYLLPRVSARVAQNERTLFTYLNSLDATDPVSPTACTTTSPMRCVRTPWRAAGYHTWLETESALHKARNGFDEKTLKCACLLGLGLVGERSRVSRRLLESAVAGFEQDKAARESVKRLIEEKTAALPAQRRQHFYLARHGPRSSRASPPGEGTVGSAIRSRLVPGFRGAPRPMETDRLQRRVRHRTLVRDSLRRRRGHHHGGQHCRSASPVAAADGVLYVVVPDSYDEAEEVRKRLTTEDPRARRDCRCPASRRSDS